MSWWKSGFEAQKEAYDYDDSQKGPRRFWMPAETEKRVLMLDDEPQMYWEHIFKHGGSWQNYEPCKIRNRLDNDCVVCDRYPDRKPSFVGMLSCISMTSWETKGGKEFCYGRELIIAKMGSKDKPGMLKKLDRLKKQHDGLTGGIFNLYRAGGKTESIGDEWTFIEKIPKDKIIAKGKEMLKEWAKRVNKSIDDPEKYVTPEKLWERYPWVPFDYDEVINIRSNEELKVMFGSSTSDDNDDGGSKAADDDSPY